MDLLRFPAHFPPTDKWKKFFIGVRWLGPDLSFFKDLKELQANRDATTMAAWGGGPRQMLAEKISQILKSQLGWRSPIFVPDDASEVAFHGPRFDFVDSDSAFEDVVELLERDYGLKLPPSFWEKMGKSTFGELVDAILAQHTNNSDIERPLLRKS